ncbi:ThiF family adenylyltransferase [Kribbella sp. VKM Ac-2571]|uniref:HesA/MoeB/ThiF family protein n=1 Tax=Kribbella sp. VKM Ac-2571 TaxID=2512222 RepID=UPI0014152F11|nr:ThiF family adenylyltransferase [Kribbella sp. VKM Ac-2571]
MAFILASHSITGPMVKLVGRELVVAGPDDLSYQSAGGIGPTGGFVAAMLTRCRQEGWSLIEVHSHPFDRSNRTTFSGIDWGNDRVKMPQLAAMLPAPFHHATMVVGRRSLDAHYYERRSGDILPVERITLVGATDGAEHPLRYLDITSRRQEAPAEADGRRSRQVPLVGRRGQAAFPKATVGVVGLGGLGSFAAWELAYLGIGRLVLIDADEVAETNLNRLLGAGPQDIGRPKVEVLAEQIERVAPDVDVVAIAEDILSPAALDRAKSADVLLGCVDNHGARLTLNHLAIRYLVPLLDAGTGARMGADGRPAQVGGQVQLVVPGRGCLECRGFIDPNRAAFDLASPEVQQYERDLGYGTEEIAPSVIFLNGVVASMQVAEVARLLAGPRSGQGRQVSLIMYDALAQKSITAGTSTGADCPTCGPSGVVGVGDLAPLHRATASGRSGVPSRFEAVGASGAGTDPD